MTFITMIFQVITATIMKTTVFWHGRAIVLLMEAASASETSIKFHQTTRRNIPEDSHLYP